MPRSGRRGKPSRKRTALPHRLGVEGKGGALRLLLHVLTCDFMPLPTLYTPSEVAKKLKVNRRSVYHWLNSGFLPALKAGQSWRVTEADLMDFLRKPTQAKPAR